MVGRPRPRRRSGRYAWLITNPLALFAFLCAVAFWLQDPDWYKQWLGALVALVCIIVSYIGVINVVIRRNTISFYITEVPFLLALFYLPPVAVIVVMTLAALVAKLTRGAVLVPSKFWFNVAKSSAGAAAAVLVLAAMPPIRGAGPGTWAILTAAVGASVLVELLSLAAVMAVVQGARAGQDVIRSSLPLWITAGVNVVVGLIFLVALEATAWSATLLAVLVVAIMVMLRSYAEFFRQHRTLADVYELTKAVRDEGTDAGLPDVMLERVRALMRSEYATLWLSPQGRHPEVLLTARVENKGLLDLSPTPAVIRERGISDGHTVAVGNQFPESEQLRQALRDTKVKDVIVVPLRSGHTPIGSLEVINRLGDTRTFRPADVQVLETIAAHVAVAVENTRLVDRLRYDAYHDRLTGLPNRRRITDALAESVKVRAEDEVVAVLLFDVDGQRDVNESMGHAAGDKLLAEVAGRLRGIAGPGALVGRIGGDEFVVTLRAESTDATVQLATEMREQLRGPMTVGTLTLDLDTAVGVAVYPDHGTDPETLIQRAELAANAAKVLPYGVQLFHPALESRAVRRLGIAADLRVALDTGAIDVYFQPKVTLTDRHLVGVECLARWQHPAQGEVAPDDFVAVAEHTGQLSRLTEVVLTEGLRRCREWADQDRPLSIAVNLSVRTLLDSRFPDQVASLLERYGVAAAQVTFEISEPGMLGDIERVLPTLYRLRDLGVRLSVDDFGTGASSLSYLRQWPVHEVKIDDSFVQGMATDTGDLAIVRAVVSLAREFGLTVVAEGVESELTLDLLEEMGCEIGQGYLFSRPLPYERLEAWFSAQTEPATTPAGEVRKLRAVG
ncbi:putative bifunctional diguanylate cyclase/phosphodiesterase [Paractinoplanes atraurantiacus]|uniref:Diguanylate cyclase (GGDEF) domain-containing protein n=1 Tax=Paractinoplanes atraurantiacus TaxID=1036182 RepID=A0A285IVG9_9ACTN|nr:bifunctional diguanylate cyclase/phosphodiesterase [Actinoplanes atraurantiacus]SNY52009.1 diguanylate cyclase (GGDEF) domain-containing protein [Actinoplanes atraurantiacus]